MVLNSHQVVLVTGCTNGGIGSSLCQEYARKGCIVYATARNPEAMSGLEHPNIRRHALDVTSDENVEALVKLILDNESKIDILVNNAGMNLGGALLDTSVDAFKATYEVNTFAVVRLARAVFPSMAARKSGLIVNLGSVGGDIPTPWNGAYTSSKAALRGISDVLWMELKPFNVHCTHISAGAVRSNIAQNAMNKGLVMPEDSLYAKFAGAIERRVWVSQDATAIPTAEFAKKVVSATLSSSPPRYITLGGHSTVCWLLSWLPKSWALNIMWAFCQKGMNS